MKLTVRDTKAIYKWVDFSMNKRALLSEKKMGISILERQGHVVYMLIGIINEKVCEDMEDIYPGVSLGNILYNIC